MSRPSSQIDRLAALVAVIVPAHGRRDDEIAGSIAHFTPSTVV
jgi:hypothetical protein